MEIFKNAKFGDRFITRDGRMAIYKGYFPSKINGLMFHFLMVENEDEFVGYNSNGYRGWGGEQQIDIISRWQEPINEDELAEKFIQGFDYAIEISPNLLSLKKDRALAKSAFKAGCRKVLELYL